MPSFEEHCAETEKKLGARFAYVHSWLDAYQPSLGPNHRKVRHNAKGIEDVRRKWGDRAAEAAKIHIDQDENSHVKEGALWVPKQPIERDPITP